MRRRSRFASALALAGLALAGCGGNSGVQPTSVSRTLSLSTAIASPSGTSVDTVGGVAVQPLATFGSSSDQRVTLWGTRDASTGAIAGVSEAVYASDAIKPLYARYDANGGLVSVKDSGTGSYVTLSELEASGDSIVGVGYDATSGKTGSIRATLSNVGVTVAVLDDGSKATGRSRFVPNAEIARSLARLGFRAETDPLNGLTTVYKDSDARTRILTAIFRAASLVVDKPFDSIISDTAGFLSLDQLAASYQTYLDKGGVVGVATDGTTPGTYVSGLPVPTLEVASQIR